MGEVSILTGRAGSGKSRYLRRIAADIAEKGGSVLYIVPEQFTFETERALSAALGGGLWNAEVYSFTSLARRVLQGFGERRSLISEQGRLMVIRKCVDELAPRLTAFARVYQRSGFTAECASFFMEAKRAGITSDDLIEIAHRQGEETSLGARLNDLALIYESSEAQLSQTRLDNEESLRLLSKLLPKSEFAARHVIIDGFDMISKRLYAAVGALIDSSASVTIALRLDTDEHCRDKAVFSSDRRILSNILSLCEERGIAPRFIQPEGEESRHACAALRHMESEGFAFPYKKFQGSSDGAIELFAATDIKAEVTAAAEKVQRLIDEGYRYRDIAIIASNTEKYLEPMTRALRQRRIPFFTDAKRALISYAASEATLIALRLSGGNYTYESIVSLVKTGLCGVDAKQAEIFENYVLKRGLKGSAFKAPFGEDAPPAAEEVRRAVIEPLEQLSESMRAASDASDMVRALYAYMDSIRMREQLNEQAEELRSQGRLERAEETAQVYNLLLEVLDQIYWAFGNTKLSRRRFSAIYKEGVDAYEVGVIPAAADQVMLGSLGRSKARSIRALIILGAANGHFPAVHSDDGMIDDEERLIISGFGAGELPCTAELNDKEIADAYGAVTKPTEKLYLSYTMGSGSDTAAPCELMDRIEAMFDDVQIKTDIFDSAAVTAPSAYSLLIKRLRTGVENGKMEQGTEELYASLYSDEEYRTRLSEAEAALIPSADTKPFGEELAHKLYGNPFRGGVTSLEKFNGCPFKHFASVGLKLMPRKEYREKKTDEGIFCHEAIERFTARIIELGGIAGIDAQGVDKIMDSIIPELISTHNGGVFTDTARNRAAAGRLIRRVEATAHAIAEQLRRGKFEISAAEAEFGIGKKYPELVLELPRGNRYILNGRIDRIDSYTSPAGEKYVRVIDYKSKAGAAFDCADIDDGTRLQLPLYIAAIEAAGSFERAAGMYYMPVQESITTADVKAMDEEAIAKLKEKLFSEFRLRGICLNDAELIKIGGGASVQPTVQSGWRLTREQLSSSVEYALKRAAKTAEKIAAGHMEARPIMNRRGYDECGICDYKDVCGFDATLPNCKYRLSHCMSRDEFLAEVSDAKLDE